MVNSTDKQVLPRYQLLCGCWKGQKTGHITVGIWNSKHFNSSNRSQKHHTSNYYFVGATITIIPPDIRPCGNELMILSNQSNQWDLRSP